LGTRVHTGETGRISSSCVPVSTRRPLSMTTMRSARPSVVSRCRSGRCGAERKRRRPPERASRSEAVNGSGAVDDRERKISSRQVTMWEKECGLVDHSSVRDTQPGEHHIEALVGPAAHSAPGIARRARSSRASPEYVANVGKQVDGIIALVRSTRARRRCNDGCESAIRWPLNIYHLGMLRPEERLARRRHYEALRSVSSRRDYRV
jgi:hypothetical protein